MVVMDERDKRRFRWPQRRTRKGFIELHWRFRLNLYAMAVMDRAEDREIVVDIHGDAGAA